MGLFGKNAKPGNELRRLLKEKKRKEKKLEKELEKRMESKYSAQNLKMAKDIMLANAKTIDSLENERIRKERKKERFIKSRSFTFTYDLFLRKTVTGGITVLAAVKIFAVLTDELLIIC